MQVNTSRMALMCKELKEESSMRNQDIVDLERELSEAQARINSLAAERDAMKIKLDRHFENRRITRRICKRRDG